MSSFAVREEQLVEDEFKKTSYSRFRFTSKGCSGSEP